MQKTIKKIAKESLDIDTLETRNSDHYDFHDVSVWGIREALEKAYKAGQQSIKSTIK